MTTGYSGTLLDKKLGLRNTFNCVTYDAPKDYLKWIKSLPTQLNLSATMELKSADFIHAFFRSRTDLEKTIPHLKETLSMTGMLWVSWPKGRSKIKTDLNREIVRDYLLANGLVDIKVAAIDDDWSALKFVYRLKDRK